MIKLLNYIFNFNNIKIHINVNFNTVIIIKKDKL